MFSDDFNETIDRFTRGIVRRKVQQLIGRAGFTSQDREDLEQQLLARVLESLVSFEPKRAHRNRFITAVVERYVANVLRNKRAAKRDYRRISSLNVTIETGGETAVELAQLIDQQQLDPRHGRHPRSAGELVELVLDVAEVLDDLPHDLRDLAERLKSQTVSQIARETCVPRTTLYESVRRLRRRFERAGLKEYL